MNIAGWAKSSLINFPKCASTVVFLGGCNFRCGYCHNPEIVLSKNQSVVSEEEFFQFLDKRKKFLDGVCITGGEPTLSKELYSFIEEIKEKGYKVKIDTNGTNPEMIKMLIANKLLDYVAMDIKAPLDKYEEVVGVKTDAEVISESIDILMDGEIEYEFRTTVCQELTGIDEIKAIGQRIKGANQYFVQNYRKVGVDTGAMLGADKRKHFTPHDKFRLEEFRDMAENYIANVGIR